MGLFLLVSTLCSATAEVRSSLANAVFEIAPASQDFKAFPLSEEAEVSIITCGPGTGELYAAFGHSAFRIHDASLGLDRVYNYGTFDFDTPNFYLKFAQGKLLYQLSAYDFSRFLRGYQREGRWVKGQVLDLTPEEVQAVFNFLEFNALPQNRSYKYDFFYDNCSTKLYEVLQKVLGDRLVMTEDFAQAEMTHREMISLYTEFQPWGEYGIDLALGAQIDRVMDNEDYLFLPDYVFKAFSSMLFEREEGQVPALKRTEELLPEQKMEADLNLLSPMQINGMVLLVVLFCTYLDHRRRKRTRWLDGLLLLGTGLAGTVLLLLWFATDHTATAENFNVLWAFAPNLVYAFLLQRKPHVTHWYLFTLILLLDLLVLIWIFGLQSFNLSLLPLLAALYVRYIFLWSYFRRMSRALRTEVVVEGEIEPNEGNKA